MANQAWLEEVQRRLAQSNLPPTYVQRFAEELSDHLEDFKEENMNTDTNGLARLGDPKQVAEAAVVAYRQRSFLGRHPTVAFLVFGLSPVVSLIVLFVAFSCLIGLSLFSIGITNEQSNRLGIVGSAVACFMQSLLTVVIPSILATILYGQLAKRLDIGRKWILLSSVTLAVFASSICYWRVETEGPSWMLGFLWSGFFSGGSVAQIQHLVQFVVPLAVGWWFMRHGRNHDQLQLAS
jgi:uncharacterized integral membrane protein